MPLTVVHGLVPGHLGDPPHCHEMHLEPQQIGISLDPCSMAPQPRLVQVRGEAGCYLTDPVRPTVAVGLRLKHV